MIGLFIWEGVPSETEPPPDPGEVIPVRGITKQRWAPWNQVLEGPEWKCVTRDYTYFQAASTTKTSTIFTLPPNGIIHNIKIKHKIAFAGTSISACTVSVGIAGSATKYAHALDILQAVSATAYSIHDGVQSESCSASTAIIATATSTGANLSALSAGVVQFWINWSVAK
jgi:hypothetical protein